MATFEKRSIALIAEEIRANWTNVNYAALPYLNAMFSIQLPTDRYIAEDGKTIVLYFLSNANSWRGDVARRIKKELKELIK